MEMKIKQIDIYFEDNSCISIKLYLNPIEIEELKTDWTKKLLG